MAMMIWASVGSACCAKADIGCYSCILLSSSFVMTFASLLSLEMSSSFHLWKDDDTKQVELLSNRRPQPRYLSLFGRSTSTLDVWL